MAPTGPITSWQILLEMRAASSRSVGWARSVISGPLFLSASRHGRLLTREAHATLGQHDRLRKGFVLIHASPRASKAAPRRQPKVLFLCHCAFVRGCRARDRVGRPGRITKEGRMKASEIRGLAEAMLGTVLEAG